MGLFESDYKREKGIALDRPLKMNKLCRCQHSHPWVFIISDSFGNGNRCMCTSVDGTLGLKVINARTKIEKNAVQTIIADEQQEVINKVTDSGLRYGVRVGFYRKRYVEKEGSKTALPSLSLKGVYSWGDKVSYGKAGIGRV